MYSYFLYVYLFPVCIAISCMYSYFLYVQLFPVCLAISCMYSYFLMFSCFLDYVIDLCSEGQDQLSNDALEAVLD